MNRRQFTLGALFGGIAAYTALSPKNAFAQYQDYSRSSSSILPVESYIDPQMASGSREPIGMTLVIGFDISGSINSSTNEYTSQLLSIAESIERDDFREAIFAQGGPGSLAIFIVDYDHQSKLQIGGVDFRDNHPAKFRAFADRVRRLERRNSNGSTDQSAALENAAMCFEAAKRIWPCERNHVDIMTDGDGYATRNKVWIKKLAEEHGASVSSMATRTSYNKDMREWCEENLRTPSGLIGPNGRPVPAGVAVEVATEVQTQQSNISRYSNNVHHALRNHLNLQASYDGAPQSGNITRFASTEQLEMPSRRRLFIPDSFDV